MEAAACGRARDPGAGELQRPLRDGRRARPRRRRLVPDGRAVPERWRGERIVLRFDAATHSAVVWVGETQVAEHEGGYTPFEADVTDLVEPGGEVRITAVVSNVLTWHTIPPGYVVDTPGGRRQQVFHDFFNYAGLHRTVWLYTTPRSYVADVTVVTGLDSSVGTVRYAVETGGGPGGRRRRSATPREARSRARPARRAS